MKQYTFYQVDLTIIAPSSPPLKISGYPEQGSIISIGRAVPQTEKVIDARGAMTAVTSADRSGALTFDLLQNSDDHLFLYGTAVRMHNYFLGTDSGGVSDDWNYFSATLRSRTDGYTATFNTGILTMQPATSTGTALNTVTWTLEFETMYQAFTGGLGQDLLPNFGV